ncbi:hypothetical protein [Buttiauxella noackiae]|uniref:hypothetical protein n=1 Tax=Buttiauxella noackiae TaxID=82992 RepID=UPI000550490F|nr:hypothetical protein [Buttiauxella noackiae]
MFNFLYVNLPKKKDARILMLSKFALYFVFAMFCVFFIRYQYFLLGYINWGDEAETVVTVKMMASGMKLYSEIFNHHGPLTFLPGLLVEHFVSIDIRGHRILIALFQIFAFVALCRSPVLTSNLQRMVVFVCCAIIVLVCFPDGFGHTYQYQTLAGIMLVIILALYVLPALLNPEKLTGTNVVLGSFLLSSLPFLAITYLPVAGLLYVAALRANFSKHLVIGTLLAVVTNLFFLGYFGSFAGFLAFHIYLNAEILPEYTGLQPGWMLIITAIQALTSDFSHLFALFIILNGAFSLSKAETKFPWRTSLIIVGLCSLLIRGPGFHGMPFFYTALSFIPFIFTTVDDKVRSHIYIFIGFVLICIIKLSLLLPGDKLKLTSIPTATDKSQSEFSILVKEFTKKNDRIISYSFQTQQYIVSDRLPASGYFFYLPWQAKYNENPKFGVSIDPCKQITEARPKVMLLDKWLVWGRYPWESYAGCIQKIADKNYLQVPGKPFYLRKDLFATNDYFLSNDRIKKPSPALQKGGFIPLILKDRLVHSSHTKKIVGMGVLFGTYMRTNSGMARLVLNTDDGNSVNLDFSLSQLLDNRYKYFSLDEGVYVGGEIKSITGDGVSTWESKGTKPETLTCLKYYYSDGTIDLTPGCPII